MVKDQSFSVPKEERLIREGNTIQLDYFEFESTRILIMVETTSWYMAARVVENKSYTGQIDQKVAMVGASIKDIGKRNVTLQCDSEATIMFLAQGIADRFTHNKGKGP